MLRGFDFVFSQDFQCLFLVVLNNAAYPMDDVRGDALRQKSLNQSFRGALYF